MLAPLIDQLADHLVILLMNARLLIGNRDEVVLIQAFRELLQHLFLCPADQNRPDRRIKGSGL